MMRIFEGRLLAHFGGMEDFQIIVMLGSTYKDEKENCIFRYIELNINCYKLIRGFPNDGDAWMDLFKDDRNYTCT